MVKQGGVECRQEMLDLYIRKRRQLERKLTRSDKGVRKIVGVAMGICLSGHIRHASEKTPHNEGPLHYTDLVRPDGFEPPTCWV